MNRTVTLLLPEELVERAEAAGLLTESSVTRWLEVQLEQEAARKRYLQTLDDLRSTEPPMTPEEIQAEIDAYRADKRSRDTMCRLRYQHRHFRHVLARRCSGSGETAGNRRTNRGITRCPHSAQTGEANTGEGKVNRADYPRSPANRRNR